MPLPDGQRRRGNVFLLDHGLTRYWPVTSQPDAEWLGAVPIAHDFEPARCEAQGQPKTPPENAGRFNPALRFGPLTYRAPWPVPAPDADPATCSWLPASTLLAQDPTRGRPMLSLKSLAGEAFAPAPMIGAVAAGDLLSPSSPARDLASRIKLIDASQRVIDWQPRRDLLESGPEDRHVVVEPDNEGRGRLRFGDGTNGRAVEPREGFWARYRVGNGTDGNVGPETINQLFLPDGASLGAVDLSRVEIRNPLPASGGFAAEPLDDVKRLAPERFQTTLLRAVIPDDYAQITMARFPEVQRAAARERSTGSGSLIEVAVDFRAAVPADQVPTRLASIATALESFRRIGHAVRVQPAQSVPLDIALTVNLQPTTPRAGDRPAQGCARYPPAPRWQPWLLPSRQPQFRPGHRLEPAHQAAQGVAGVQNVVVMRFQKLGALPGPAQTPVSSQSVRSKWPGWTRIRTVPRTVCCLSTCEVGDDRPERGS